MSRGRSEITVGGTCDDESGCRCSYDYNSEKFGKGTAETYNCGFGQKCYSFDAAYKIGVSCEAKLQNGQVCGAKECSCYASEIHQDLGFKKTCEKGATCLVESRQTLECKTYMKPGEVCQASKECWCTLNGKELKVPRSMKCVKNGQGSLELGASDLIHLGVLCEETKCKCDSRSDHDGRATLDTTLEISKGFMCFKDVNQLKPIAAKVVKHGDLTNTNSDLMCIANKLNPYNPRTFALCSNLKVCQDYKGNAYCAQVVTQGSTTKTFEATGNLGLIIAAREFGEWKQKFCLPHQVAEQSIGASYRCRSSGTGPKLTAGQVCYATDEKCGCGVGPLKCGFGEQCDLSGSPKCTAVRTAVKCPTELPCPCYSEKKPKWTKETPVCDLSYTPGKFVSTQTPHFSLEEIEDLYMAQVIENLRTAGAFGRRLLAQQTPDSSTTIKI